MKAEQAMKAEIALVRSVRERICPVLSQQADGANANDRNEPTIDYQALIVCRYKAEEQLLRSRPTASGSGSTRRLEPSWPSKPMGWIRSCGIRSVPSCVDQQPAATRCRPCRPDP